MRNYTILIIGLFCLIFILYMHTKTKITKYQGEGFLLQYPGDIKIEKNSPVEDFYTCTFKLGDKVILSGYIGNQPSLSLKNRQGIEIKRGYINNLAYESYIAHTSDNTKNKEILIKLSDKEWPMYIHLWYSELTSKYTRIAEKIISSIKKNKGRIKK